MENKGLRYTNKYLPTDVFQGSETTDTRENFKRYYTDRKTETDKQKLEKFLEETPRHDWLGRIPQHILTKNNFDSRKFLNNDLIDLSEGNTVGNQEFRYIKPKRTLITIDSRDRDKSLYPKPDEYKIELRKTFCNIKRISLRSTTFPNSSQTIRDTPVAQANNNIFWQNDGPSTTIYNAVITPGNYSPSSLAAEITTRMNAVPRDDGSPQTFSVTIDQVTDLVTISRFEVISANNVMNADTGSPSIITVDLSPNTHSLNTDDLVIISGAFSFGGVSTAELNGSKTITVLDANSFTYELSSGSTVTANASNAGGSIDISKGVDFKLFFDTDDYPNTVGDILGFQLINTDFAPTHLNTVVSQAFPINTIYPLGVDFVVIVLNKPHELVQSTEMRFENITEFSASINNKFTDGTGYLLIPLTTADETSLVSLYNFDPSLTPNAFKIAIDMSGETYQNMSFPVGISNVVPLADDSYAIAVDPVYPVITGFYPFSGSFVAVEFDGNHGFLDGDTVVITELNPSSAYMITNLSASDILALQSSVDPNYDIFDGVVDYNNYFRITAVGTLFEKFYRQIDSDYLLFKPYPSGYSTALQIGARTDLPDTYLSSCDVTHTDEGFLVLPITVADQAFLDAIQLEDPSANIDANFKIIVPSLQTTIGDTAQIHNGAYTYTRTNNKPVVLTGENYIFMTSPQLDSMCNTGSVTNIFGKLQLAAAPGTIIFNSFISNPMMYDDSPLPMLSELEFSFRDHSNTVVNFNDIDHSFTIEIVEYKDKLKYNDFDSRRGRYDDIRMRNDY
jgi:hypothetical protein